MNSMDFNQVYTIYAKRLHGLAYKYTKDWLWAEDIVQEAFIKAFKKIDTIEDTGKLGAWLSAITARTAIDFLRSEKRNKRIPVDITDIELMMGRDHNGMNTEEAVDIRLFQEDLGRSMEHLSKEFQEVLILKVTYGLKENEIASLLDLKAATVKTRLYRARKQLKQVFAVKESA